MVKLIIYMFVGTGGVTLHETGNFPNIPACQSAGAAITVTARQGSLPPGWGFMCVKTVP
jgi:hypothetical protein